MQHVVVRLSERDMSTITMLFIKFFNINDALWLFGSRADMTKRGGDIDLYIETSEANVDTAVTKKRNFVMALHDEIGDQKIDVVLNLRQSKHHLPIFDIAKTTGVRLV